MHASSRKLVMIFSVTNHERPQMSLKSYLKSVVKLNIDIARTYRKTNIPTFVSGPRHTHTDKLSGISFK